MTELDCPITTPLWVIADKFLSLNEVFWMLTEHVITELAVENVFY